MMRCDMRMFWSMPTDKLSQNAQYVLRESLLMRNSSLKLSHV